MDPIADAVSSHDDSGEEEGFEDSEDEDDGDLLCRWKTRSRRKCARWRWKMHGERIVESDQGEYKVWFDCWYHGVQFIEQVNLAFKAIENWRLGVPGHNDTLLGWDINGLKKATSTSTKKVKPPWKRSIGWHCQKTKRRQFQIPSPTTIFEDKDGAPITFSILPLILDDAENAEAPRQQVSVRGTTDGGLQSVFKGVIAWKLSLMKRILKYLFLKENKWIKF
ncbi:hypothetical protein HPP92_004245 [Vanilla planifolia]|uniref:Uncharacterized protein n=1 Tax=Vanilla planifolia TaxID=51239 RepID=A0A835RJH2_VANPL|nr:hypothetical protein HPP92_004245 [Vanilla planifolia]